MDDSTHGGKDGERQEVLLLPLSAKDPTKDEEHTPKSGRDWFHPALYVVYVKYTA